MAFLIDNFPAPRLWLVAGPPALAWAYACLYLAGWLKRDAGWATGYTRKTFHVLIFTSAALVQWLLGISALFVFGTMTSLVIFYAVWRGSGHLLYEAMARERDAPRRTYYILAPYAATLAGGLLSNLLFGPVAIVGYLVTGFGDAIGEPVGVRFGRHPYRVPSFRGVPATRTIEGSVAVFLACGLAIAAAVALSPELAFTPVSWARVPLLALACALLEAVSPHGWDNAVLQVVPTFLAAWLL
jgi:phytol kinase